MQHDADGVLDDAVLVQRAQEGYLDAYEQLVHRHSKSVFHLAYRLLGDHTVAQDLAQESFLEAWRALPRFRGEAAFGTWLYRITTNRCLNQLRRPGRPDPLDAVHQLATDAPGPADDAVARAQIRAVRLAVARLPPAQRVPLVLSEYQGLSYAEIAEITTSTVPAVRSQLFRARRALARSLQEWR